MQDSHLTIKRLSEEDRPREKFLQKGKSSLSDAELIAIIINSGNKEQTAVELSQYILVHCENNLANLARLSVKELQKFKGIGEAKAIAIVATLELGRRRKDTEQLKKIKIKSSTDSFNVIRGHLTDLTYEEFWIILLNRQNEVIKKEMISKGGVSGTVVDPKIIFKRALEESASALILAHNHPSGNLTASKQDLVLTKKFKAAGDVLDIQVIDHIIVTDNAYLSFADDRML